MVSDSFTQFQISIHALRVEGDFRSLLIRSLSAIFLSTPSGWRATLKRSPTTRKRRGFLSTPSGWRATGLRRYLGRGAPISIHALRVEGDATTEKSFMSTHERNSPISIHALRVEGDFLISGSQSPPRRYFYPRPPGGGRLPSLPIRSLSAIFLSTPSGWRATARLYRGILISRISIHALRVEGDYYLFYICNTFFISIHALRVEGDAVLDKKQLCFLYASGERRIT